MFYIYMGYTLKCKCKLFTLTCDLLVMYRKGYMKVGIENDKNSKPKHITWISITWRVPPNTANAIIVSNLIIESTLHTKGNGNIQHNLHHDE
jgi:hypothetical protein